MLLWDVEVPKKTIALSPLQASDIDFALVLIPTDIST